MSARTRTPDATCARWYNRENRHARRLTRRMERRLASAYLRAVDVDAAPAPVVRRTQGWITH